MGRVCSICKHPERQAIEDAVTLRHESYHVISRQFRVSEDAIQRHIANHLTQAIQQVKADQEEQSGSRALENLALAEQHLLTILALPLEDTARDISTTIRALAELRQQNELRAKLEGELDENSITITAIPEWRELRALLLDALRAHPQAKLAVIRALEAYDHDRIA